MKAGQKAKNNLALNTHKEVGLRWRRNPSAGLLHSDKTERFYSECKTRPLHLSLFVNDTTIVGKKYELEQGINDIKRFMILFEEKKNDAKGEEVIFGKDDSHGNRKLGLWLGNQDVLLKKKRAAKLWGKFKT